MDYHRVAVNRAMQGHESDDNYRLAGLSNRVPILD